MASYIKQVPFWSNYMTFLATNVSGACQEKEPKRDCLFHERIVFGWVKNAIPVRVVRILKETYIKLIYLLVFFQLEMK